MRSVGICRPRGLYEPDRRPPRNPLAPNRLFDEGGGAAASTLGWNHRTIGTSAPSALVNAARARQSCRRWTPRRPPSAGWTACRTLH